MSKDDELEERIAALERDIDELKNRPVAQPGVEIDYNRLPSME